MLGQSEKQSIWLCGSRQLLTWGVLWVRSSLSDILSDPNTVFSKLGRNASLKAWKIKKWELRLKKAKHIFRILTKMCVFSVGLCLLVLAGVSQYRLKTPDINDPLAGKQVIQEPWWSDGWKGSSHTIHSLSKSREKLKM